MNKRLIITATSAGIVALLALTLMAFRVTSLVGSRPVVGALAPDFELALFPEYRAGLSEKMRLSDLHGQVVVINFWASWCVECKKEAADLEATYRRFKERGVVFIGVDYLDTEKFAYSYLREFNISYANGIDVQQRVAQLYRITGVPETFVVDKNGIIRRVELQRMSAQQLSDAIELALGV